MEWKEAHEIVEKGRRANLSPALSVVDVEKDGLTVELLSAVELLEYEEKCRDVFELIETNMRELYSSSSWGWDEEVKQKELSNPDTMYVLLSNEDKRVVGFCQFYCDVEETRCMKFQPVLYCVELQISSSLRRRGVGRRVMHFLVEAAKLAEMPKVMLTVFTFNTDALEFYQRIGFAYDELSPRADESIDFDYFIFSKCVVDSFETKPPDSVIP